MNNYKRTLLMVGAVFVLFLAAPSILPPGTNVAAVEARKARLSKKKLSLKIGKTHQLRILYRRNKKVSWHTTNSAVASVRAGKVTAKKAGTCIIYARYGKRKLKCRLTVKNPSFTVANSSVSLQKNETQTILVYSERKSAISVRTSNKYIAEAVPLTGPGSKMPVRITGGDRAGTATITVTEKASGLKRVINVTVAGENVFEVVSDGTSGADGANVSLAVGEVKTIWIRSDLRADISTSGYLTCSSLAWGGAWNGVKIPLRITGIEAGEDIVTLTEYDEETDSERSIMLTVTVTEE